MHTNVVDPDLSIAFYTIAFEATRRTELAGANRPAAAAPAQAWYQQFGHGRSLYTSLGHRADLWSDDPTFRAHMLGALQWALGLAD